MHNAKLAAEKQQLKEAYGKIPVEEYLLLKAAVETTPKNFEETLREDYEFYLSNGFLKISYCCGCKVCGYQFTYKKDVLMPL